jgi:uncharacterized protein YkwD
MRRAWTSAACAAFAAILLAAPAGARSDWAPAGAHRATGPLAVNSVEALEAQVLAEVNGARRQRGLRPLRLSTPLSHAAAFHSRDMARRGYFSHNSASGTEFWRRVRRFYGSHGYRSWAVGENLLWASPDLNSSTALSMWMASPPHRANLLSRRWREIGLAAVHVSSGPGVFAGHEVTIVTANFGARSR